MSVLTSKSDYGLILWLTDEELCSEKVKREIESLKSIGRTIIFCSGKSDMKVIVKQLIEKSLKTESLK